jgi:hypothetical protein
MNLETLPDHQLHKQTNIRKLRSVVYVLINRICATSEENIPEEQP